MGDAFKNGGYIIAPILTVLIALISVHCQHILINCSEKMRVVLSNTACADYAETVEECFENGPAKLQKFSKPMKTVVNIFICVTQMGFCCIYFVFMGTNIGQILKHYGIDIDVRYVMAMAFLPVLLTCMITNLKWLTPVSMLANICMFVGLSLTMYGAFEGGLPNLKERHEFTSPSQLALFFGTTIFAFEGIALVLPLKNEMKTPRNFEKPVGVLNVGMCMVSFFFMFAGFFGYWKWGEEVGGSLTLNLGDSIFGQCVKVIVSTGVLLGFPLQFFIPIQIMLPSVLSKFGCEQKPLLGELIFRTFMVAVALGIAELVPALGLFISLIGSLCSTALALVFPPMIELLLKGENDKGPGFFIVSKNIFIMMLALLGFATGTYESLNGIITHFGKSEL